MVSTIDQVWRDFNTAGVPASGEHKPSKAEIRALLKAIMGTASNPAIVKKTRAALDAVTPAGENHGGIVLNDPSPANNGYYSRDAGAWVFGRGFPDTFAMVNQLSGTNAVIATVSPGITPSNVEVFYIKPVATNSGNVTLALNGADARPVRNVNGGELAPGEWTAGRMIMLIDGGAEYRLLSDPDADGAALAAGGSATSANASAVQADAAAGRAEDAAAAAEAIAGFDGTALLSLLTKSAISAMHSAKGAGYRTQLPNGIVDGFGGTDGVAGASLNVELDYAHGRLVPMRGAFVSMDKALGIRIGNMTANGGLVAAFDNVTTQDIAASANSNPSLQSGFVGKHFYAAPQRIYAVNVYATSDYGYDSSLDGFSVITMTLRGKNGAAPATATDGVLLGTTVIGDAAGIIKSIFSSDVTTAWDYLWVHIASSAFSYVATAEIDFLRPGDPLAMTFVTAPAVLEASPASVSAKLLIRPLETLALNTDLILEVSRDGGTTWLSAPMTQKAVVGADRYVEAGPIVMSGPHGAYLVARVTTPTAKNVEFTGLALEWA